MRVSAVADERSEPGTRPAGRPCNAPRKAGAHCSPSAADPRCTRPLMIAPMIPPPSRRGRAATRAGSRGVRGVLTDIDDTLTTRGRDPDGRRRRARGAARGRPAGHRRHRAADGLEQPIARDMPLDAIVAENGAVALFRDGGGAAHRIRRRPSRCARANAARLRAVAARIVLREVPGATLARDSAGRVTDIADRPRRVRAARRERIARVVAMMRARRHERDGQLDPRQRLVRRAHQAERRALDGAAPARPRPRRRARRTGSTSATRPTTSRCSRTSRSAVGVANLLRLRRPAAAAGRRTSRRRPRPRLRRGRRGAARRARGRSSSARAARRDARSSPRRWRSARRSRSAWRASRTRCCCRRCAPTSAGATSSPAR